MNLTASDLERVTDFVLMLRDAGKPEAASWWERHFATAPDLEYGDGSIGRWRMPTDAPGKAETLAEFDAAMRKQGHGKVLDGMVGAGVKSAQGEASKGDAESKGDTGSPSARQQAAPVAPPRKRRRSKAEMAEVRAKAAERIQNAHDRATPDWLKAGEAEESAFLETLRHEA